MTSVDVSSQPSKRPRRIYWKPRGINREQAAENIGVSVSKFDQLVRDGRMPQPKEIDARLVWDRREVDKAFAALPSREEANPWDDAI